MAFEDLRASAIKHTEGDITYPGPVSDGDYVVLKTGEIVVVKINTEPESKSEFTGFPDPEAEDPRPILFNRADIEICLSSGLEDSVQEIKL